MVYTIEKARPPKKEKEKEEKIEKRKDNDCLLYTSDAAAILRV